MPRMVINGEVYEVPQSDVRIAESQYGATLDSTSVNSGPTGTNIPGAIGGAAAGAVNSIGGMRTLVGGGALGAGGMLVRHMMKNRGQATPATPATPVPAAPAATAATAAPPTAHPSEDRIREAKAAKAEADARAAAARADAAEARAKAPEKRTTSPRTPKPPKRTKRPPAKVPVRTSKPKLSLEERVPITVEGKPASRGKSQRGVSKRVLAGRAPKVAPADDLMAQLGQSVKAAGAMRGAGALPEGVRPQMFRGIKSGAIKLPGALGMLLSLLDAGSIPEQMDEAQGMGREFQMEELRRKSPQLAQYLEESQRTY